MPTFSERQGIRQPQNLNPDTMPDELRNRLWNIIKIYIDKEIRGQYSREEVIRQVWDKFFKEDTDKLKSWDSYI